MPTVWFLGPAVLRKVYLMYFFFSTKIVKKKKFKKKSSANCIVNSPMLFFHGTKPVCISWYSLMHSGLFYYNWCVCVPLQRKQLSWHRIKTISLLDLFFLSCYPPFNELFSLEEKTLSIQKPHFYIIIIQIRFSLVDVRPPLYVSTINQEWCWYSNHPQCFYN